MNRTMNHKELTPKEVDEMLDENLNKKREEELKNFTKCVAFNYERLNALCDISAIDAGGFEECCQPVGKELCRTILRDAVELLLDGSMKVNGKKNNWSNGCFGSRWFDMDAKKYGVDYIRGAFYSKTHYKGGEWKEKKPYAIQIMIEKSK